MSDHDHLNGLDSKINDRGFFERILSERDKFEEERDRRMEERFDRIELRFQQNDKALELQAREYERRLHDLNGEYQRDKQRQSQFVSLDKYEDSAKAEATARGAALLRVDEKFDEYVKRYEIRQREIDMEISAQKGAAAEAKRAAEDQGRKSNRNMAILGLALSALVFAANFIPSVVK